MLSAKHGFFGMALSIQPTQLSLTACYAKWGVAITNPRRAWSAEAEDGTVILTLWSNEMDVDRRQFSNFRPKGHKFKESWPKTRRTELLKKVAASNDKTFYSIIVTKVSENKNSFEIGPRMRLVKLNELTGEFSAERDD
jgi:hypothetical protein